MALTRKEKGKLVDSYQWNIKWAKNVVFLQQFWIPVNDINRIRIDIDKEGGKLQVVKKRIFINHAKDAGLNGGTLDEIEGSAIVLYSYQDEFAPLKVIAKYVKQWKKEDKKYSFDYLWGWFDNEWKNKEYVTSLANLPSKAELVWKFLFLMNYPLTGFVRTLDQIKNKQENNG